MLGGGLAFAYLKRVSLDEHSKRHIPYIYLNTQVSQVWFLEPVSLSWKLLLGSWNPLPIIFSTLINVMS